MKTRRFLTAALVMAFMTVAGLAGAAGSISTTSTSAPTSGLVRYKFDWTSDASGNVSGIPVIVRGGWIRQIQFVPDGGGTAPTALYDVTLLDANGVDLLAGAGADLSATVSKITTPGASAIFLDTSLNTSISPTVANAGNAKGGLIYIWIGN